MTPATNHNLILFRFGGGFCIGMMYCVSEPLELPLSLAHLDPYLSFFNPQQISILSTDKVFLIQINTGHKATKSYDSTHFGNVIKQTQVVTMLHRHHTIPARNTPLNLSPTLP
jgi:hypothetical protein